MKHALSQSLAIALLFAMTLFCCQPVSSETLDPDFGDNGLVATQIGHYGDAARSIVIAPDGKIIVAGTSSNGSDQDFTIVRYNRDGSLDRSFNEDGRVLLSIGAHDDEAFTVTLQQNGKIIVAGQSFNGTDFDLAVVRLAHDGRLDTTFGQNGFVTLPVGSMDDTVQKIIALEDDSLLVAGSVAGTAGRALTLAKFLPDGELDSQFGDYGTTLIGVGRDVAASDVAIQKDGKIVVTGSYQEMDRSMAMLLRFFPDGTMDNSFGDNGIATPLHYQKETVGNGLWIQNNGALLVAGSVGQEEDRDIALFRFTIDGQPDRSFADNGMARTDVYGEEDSGHGVIADDHGILVTGYATDNGLRDFALLRYSVAGTSALTKSSVSSPGIKTTLSIGDLIVEESVSESTVFDAAAGEEEGEIIITTTEVSPFDDVSYALAVQPDNKILVVGVSEDNGISSFALARYQEELGTAAAISSDSAVSSFIVTLTTSEITRNSAFSGGDIRAGSGLIFTDRGVVYSIAPYPILSGEGGVNDPTDPTDPTDDAGPSRSNPQPSGELTAGTTFTTLSLTTNVVAECRYASSLLSYDAMNTFDSSDATSHSTPLDGLKNGQSYSYWVLCEDTAGNRNTDALEISFSVGTTTKQLASVAGSLAGEGQVTPAAQTDSSSGSINRALFDATPPDTNKGGSTSEGSGIGIYSSILTDLTPGTRYYVRAYAVSSSGAVYYGNQLTFTTADSCFIATAAYGSIIHPYVSTLRRFRDQYMMPTAVGRSLVDLYYTVSPPMAETIANHPILRTISRVALLPIIGLSYLTLHHGIPGLLTVMFLLGACCLVFWRIASVCFLRFARE